MNQPHVPQRYCHQCGQPHLTALLPIRQRTGTILAFCGRSCLRASDLTEREAAQLRWCEHCWEWHLERCLRLRASLPAEPAGVPG